MDGSMDGIYFEMAAHANRMAKRLREGLAGLGVKFYSESQTNQIFPILPGTVVSELEKEFLFYRWTPNESYEDVAEAEDAIDFFSGCVEKEELPYVLAVTSKLTGELVGDTGINEVE